MKCFAWSAVTRSVNREKTRSPSSVIAPNRHVQSRCPQRSTGGACHAETTSHRARLGRISRSDRYKLLWRPFPLAFFESVVERSLVGLFGFSSCATRFSIAQSRFCEQPPATRIGALDAVVSSRNSWTSAGVDVGASVPTSSGDPRTVCPNASCYDSESWRFL